MTTNEMMEYETSIVHKDVVFATWIIDNKKPNSSIIYIHPDMFAPTKDKAKKIGSKFQLNDMTDTITESWINMKKDTTNYGTSTITPAKTVDAWLGCKGGRLQAVKWARQMAMSLYIKTFNASKLKPKNQQDYHQFNMVVRLMKPLTSAEVNFYALLIFIIHTQYCAPGALLFSCVCAILF